MSRARQRIEAASPHVGQGGQTAGREQTHGQAHAARKPTRQRPALLKQQAGAIGLERHDRAKALVDHALEQLSLAVPESREVGERHVDAPHGRVFAEVLQELDKLQRGTGRRRQREELVVAPSDQAQHELADRIGRGVAVTAQLVEGRVALDDLILAVGGDEPLEGLARQVVAAHRRRQTPQQRVRGTLAGVDRVELFGEPVELRQPVAGRFVAEIVGHAGKAVDVHEVRPQRAREQTRRHGKVLGARLGQHGA